jgi:threonine synthase
MSGPAATSAPAGGPSFQRCAQCGETSSELAVAATCGRCGGLLELEHRVGLDAAELARRFATRRTLVRGVETSGVWRYRELVLPSAADADVVTHGEGNTPLVDASALSRWSGVEHLLIKHEGRNPTGSFKDRGMTVALTQARRAGVRAVACASTGNTSASLAAYAARAGLPALVFVPEGKVAPAKLAQTMAYGALTLLIRGNFDDCLALARAAGEALGIYLVNSINPFRIEGQKTIVLELLDQRGWDAPDWIVLPAGNLGNTSAFGKALREAHALGLIARMPRLAAIQAAGAAPFARAFAEHFAERVTVSPETIATAIRIGAPASWDRAVRVMRETNGVVAAVSDDEILDAKAVIDAAGIGCEPASAASLAGVRQLRANGTIAPDARVVAVLTGHVLKDPDRLIAYHQDVDPAPPRANRPVAIDGTVDGVARALDAFLACPLPPA